MYDVIVVGARCAGSPTAMLLARKGYRVLLLDRHAFPSDTMHNHFIQLPGVLQLRRWGLLDQVAASNAPPIRVIATDLGDFLLPTPVAPLEDVDAHYAPRRFVLDTILVTSAVAAGADLREHFTVHEIVWDGDCVVGVRGRANGGAMVTEYGRIVIGADGARSIVARAVQAPTYNERPVVTCGYYSYFSDVSLVGNEVYLRPDCAHINFPTNNGLICAAIQVPIAEFHAFRADIEGNFFRALDRIPALGERVRAGQREERWYGTADLPNFFRKPYGPGWALVGDAGYTKDPMLAQGISDAFRDAEALAEAVDAGFTGDIPLADALAEYEQHRNDAAFSAYEANYAAATFAPFPPEVLAMRAVARAGRNVPMTAI
ncbi:MAG: NAD(P)/FAD-dependent oxidoreductase [Chloroflexota bacterium]|nr:NAD(P)/FAD-dependent oxidoreductase [Chloroflexota bacterium]